MSDQFEGVTQVVMFSRGFDRSVVALPVLRLTKTQVLTGDANKPRRWWRADGYEVGANGFGAPMIQPLNEQNAVLARRDAAIRTMRTAAATFGRLDRQEKAFALVGLAELEAAALAAAEMLRLLEGAP